MDPETNGAGTWHTRDLEDDGVKQADASGFRM